MSACCAAASDRKTATWVRRVREILLDSLSAIADSGGIDFARSQEGRRRL